MKMKIMIKWKTSLVFTGLEYVWVPVVSLKFVRGQESVFNYTTRELGIRENL